MMKRVLLSILLALIPSIASAQTTVLPKTTTLPHTTLIVGGAASGGALNVGFNDNISNIGTGNANVLAFQPIIWPGGTVASLQVWWGASESDTWGLALYADTTSGCSGAAPHCPGSKVCSSITTGSVSVGFGNTLSPTGCGTPTIGTLYWIAQITGSATQIIGLGNTLPNCNGTGLSGYADASAQGSTTFPSSDGGSAFSVAACTNIYATATCTATCPIALAAVSMSTITATPVTSITWNTTVPTGGTHQVMVLHIEYDGTVGSHASSCTDNSVSMTQVYTPIVGSGSTLFGTSYILTNPSTGTNTMACTVTSGADVLAVTELYGGVNQTGTVGNTWRSPFTALDGGGGSKIATVTVTNTSAASDLIVDSAFFDTTGTVTAFASNHVQVFSIINPIGNATQLSMAYAAGTGSNVTMSETQTTTNPAPTWAIGAFALVNG